MDENINQNMDSSRILEELESIKKRIIRLEYETGIINVNQLTRELKKSNKEEGVLAKEEDSSFESRFGESGLAFLGSIVLLLGLIFLIYYFRSIGYPILSTVVGLTASAGLFYFSFRFKDTLTVLANIVNICTYLLLFYIMISLYFSSSEPLIGNKFIAIGLASIVAAATAIFGIRNKKEGIATMVTLMILVLAILSDNTHVMLFFNVLAAGLSMYLMVKYEWWKNVLATLFFVYIVHLLWMINNPIAGNQLEIVEFHQNNFIYLFIYGVIFSLPVVFKNWKTVDDPIIISIILLNVFGFFVMVYFNIISFFPENYVWLMLLIAIFCILYSVYLKYNSNYLYSPAFFAVFGFTAISAAIYGYFNLPDSYSLLAIQSLLVISMSLWYRSRIIVVANAIIFLMLLLAYFILSDSIPVINFVFAFVAFGSARILSWKKERLKLNSESLRNFYLIVTFIMLLYALYSAVPQKYVSISWACSAIFFFSVYKIINKKKYRWLATATLIATALYLFFVDLSKMDVGYRVIAFLVLAAVFISASLYYAKQLKNKSD